MASLIHILSFCRFLSVSVDLILNMKSNQCFRLFTFYHSVDSFFLSSFLYSILKSANISDYSHFSIRLFLTLCCQSYIQYGIESITSLIHILSFCRYLFVSVDLILNMKLSQWFRLFAFYHSAVSFAFLSMLYSVLNWINDFAYSHSII